MGMRPGLLLAHATERKAQEAKLCRRGREQEIALVLGRVPAPVQFHPAGADDSAHVVAGAQGLGAQIAGGAQQIAELYGLITTHAGDRRLTPQIAVGEIIHHRLAKPAFIIQHVVRDTDPIGDIAGVVNIDASATGALAPHRLAVVVKL